jgi:hypothetical protein
VQHTLLVKVRHTLRYLVNHFQRVDSCGISVAQALQVLNEVSPRVILADLFKQSRRQANNKQSGKRDLSHQEPRWIAARAGRTKNLQHVRMVQVEDFHIPTSRRKASRGVVSESILTATVCLRHVPRYTSLKRPMPTFASRSISNRAISQLRESRQLCLLARAS